MTNLHKSYMAVLGIEYVSPELKHYKSDLLPTELPGLSLPLIENSSVTYQQL